MSPREKKSEICKWAQGVGGAAAVARKTKTKTQGAASRAAKNPSRRNWTKRESRGKVPSLSAGRPRGGTTAYRKRAIVKRVGGFLRQQDSALKPCGKGQYLETGKLPSRAGPSRTNIAEG